jgi:hypothetical protein
MKGKIQPETIQQKIFIIRGQKVMLDEDLAELYQVPTKVLVQAVKRNRKRFPLDFMFQLNKKEYDNLRSQIVTSSYGGRRYLPYAFTEPGVAMLSSVLNSERAIQMNITIIRTFIKLREFAITHKELVVRLNEQERKVGGHDKEIKIIFEVIRKLMEPPEEKPKPKIGFI